MSNPFSGIPDPELPRPIRRRFQPGLVQEALRAMREALRPARPAAQRALRQTQRVAREALWRAQLLSKKALWRAQLVSKEPLRRAQQFGEDLWIRGKRSPRTVAIISGALALTLVGAYAVSASGAGSRCPTASARKTQQFVLLMDPLRHAAAGSEVEIHYDVCGLPSGTAYRGRVQLTQQRPAGKKKSAKPKPLVISFKDQVDGVATRRHQQLDLASTRPGAYTLELSIADKQGRERKRVQKVLIKAVGR